MSENVRLILIGGDNMVGTTDPAREIVDICRQLGRPGDKRGDDYIAAKFGVDPWSRDFFEIVFSIVERLDHLRDIAADLEFDDDQLSEIKHHIEGVKSAFGRQSLASPWNNGGMGASLLSGSHVAAINVLSGPVRRKVSYPKLEKDEVDEIVGLIDALLSWLEDEQLSEKDFIRQGLIEGLKGMRIRLSRLEWLGWSYTVQSLRDVITAYMALEREFPDPQANPLAAAIEKKTLDLLEKVWVKTGQASEVRDRLGLIVEIYGAWAIARDTGISGLLTGP